MKRATKIACKQSDVIISGHIHIHLHIKEIEISREQTIKTRN